MLVISQRFYNVSKYSVNSSYFKQGISSIEHAWVSGWMFSDGCIKLHSNKYYCSKLMLQFTDIDILNKIKHSISSSHPIRISTRFSSTVKPACELQFYDNIWCSDIMNLGFIESTQNKHQNITLPSMPDNLIPHFIRGYFEGDGSIAFSTDGKLSLLIATSSAPMAEAITTHWIKKQICTNQRCKLIYKKNLRSHNRNITYDIQLTQRDDLKNVIDWLYPNHLVDNICMNRKFQQATLAKQLIDLPYKQRISQMKQFCINKKTADIDFFQKIIEISVDAKPKIPIKSEFGDLNFAKTWFRYLIMNGIMDKNHNLAHDWLESSANIADNWRYNRFCFE